MGANNNKVKSEKKKNGGKYIELKSVILFK